MKYSCLVVLTTLMCAACGDGTVTAPNVPGTAPGQVSVSSNGFAVLPCSGRSDVACALVLAGGKRLLFGAPAGISGEVGEKELAGLDGAFLFSMLPQDVEGLDEVRNRGWRAGRPEALIVAGPEGTEELLEALNLAFEQPDALSFVEQGAPRGGFDAALLQPGVEVLSEALAFDTGDLKVSGHTDGDSYISYRVEYRDLSGNWHDLVLVPCNGPDPASATIGETPQSTSRVGCGADGNDAVWPLAKPVVIAD